MVNCIVTLAGFGADSDAIKMLDLQTVEVMHEDDVWRRRTGETYGENIVRISEVLRQSEGVEQAVKRLEARWRGSPALQSAIASCNYIELQVHATDCDQEMPCIHLSAEQLVWLAECGAQIDVALQH